LAIANPCGHTPTNILDEIFINRVINKNKKYICIIRNVIK